MKKLLEKLRRLKLRRNRRIRLQKKHYRKYLYFKKRGKRGDKARTRYHLARFRANRKAVVKLTRLTRAQKKAIKEYRASRPKRASGHGDWGGSESVAREIEAFVEARRGNVSGSEKRTETYGNPGSDHHVSQTDAYAIDFLLVNDYAMAQELYAYLTGDDAGGWGGDYSNFYIVRGGRRFRIQLIAGTHGTGPHLHAGIRRA